MIWPGKELELVPTAEAFALTFVMRPPFTAAAVCFPGGRFFVFVPREAVDFLVFPRDELAFLAIIFSARNVTAAGTQA